MDAGEFRKSHPRLRIMQCLGFEVIHVLNLDGHWPKAFAEIWQTLLHYLLGYIYGGKL